VQLALAPQVGGRATTRAREGTLQIVGQPLDDAVPPALNGLLFANSRTDVPVEPHQFRVDSDSTPRAARTLADAAALDIAYRAGIVASGKQLASMAIIAMRGWDGSNISVPPSATPGSIPIHHPWFSFGLRDRIVAEAGNANNQAMWR